ncbi:MAG: DUF58 domain-containing protein [Polyangiaceae bacterium]|nr:DUF58 domain-containing protein [Polyangiaceae bacterium]
MSKKDRSPFAPYPTDWGAFAPLRLRARTVAEGVYAGMHRSVRKGSGVEFGGQRPYVLGDDLRFIDKRSLLKHERMMIREFETETDRALWLIVDATASMAFRGSGPGSKYPFAALLAASLARVALSSGDPVGVVVLGGEDGGRMVRAGAGREAFDRVVWALSSVTAAGDWSSEEDELARALGPVHDRARRGSTIVLLSDFVDLPPAAMAAVGALGTRGRRIFGVQVLSPDEIDLPFDEHARFRSLEGGVVVDADPAAVREHYRQKLAELRQRWSDDLVGRGGGLILSSTNDSPVDVVRSLLLAVSGASAPDETTRAAARGGRSR